MVSTRRKNHNVKKNLNKRKIKKKIIKKRNVKKKTGFKKAINTGFKKAINMIGKIMRSVKPQTLSEAVRVAMKTARKNNLKSVNTPRIIQIPKTGGVLPLIPLFAGLSALGALSGGAAGIAKAVGDVRNAKQQLHEAQRHNRTMEAIAMGKGVFLRPYKQGLGLFLGPERHKLF